jgi:hypothetical protein
MFLIVGFNIIHFASVLVCLHVTGQHYTDLVVNVLLWNKKPSNYIEDEIAVEKVEHYQSLGINCVAGALIR